MVKVWLDFEGGLLTDQTWNKRKKGAKDDSTGFGLDNWKGEVFILPRWGSL